MTNEDKSWDDNDNYSDDRRSGGRHLLSMHTMHNAARIVVVTHILRQWIYSNLVNTALMTRVGGDYNNNNNNENNNVHN